MKQVPITSFLVKHALSIIGSLDTSIFDEKILEIKALVSIYGKEFAERVFDSFFQSDVPKQSFYTILYMEEVSKSLSCDSKAVFERVSSKENYDPVSLFRLLKDCSFEFVKFGGSEGESSRRDFIVKLYSILSYDSSISAEVISELAILDPSGLSEESQKVIEDAKKKFQELSRFLSDQFMNHFLYNVRTGERLATFNFDKVLQSDNDILVTIHKIPNVEYIVEDQDSLNLNEIAFDWPLFKETFKRVPELDLFFEHKWKCFDLKYLMIKGILDSEPEVFYSEKFGLRIDPAIEKLLAVTSEYKAYVRGKFFWSNVRLLSTLVKIEEKIGVDLVNEVYKEAAESFPHITLYLIVTERGPDRAESRAISKLIPVILERISQSSTDKDDIVVPLFSKLFSVNSAILEQGLIDLWKKVPDRLLWIVSIVQVHKKFLEILDRGPIDFVFWTALAGFFLECLNLVKWLSSKLEERPALFHELVDYIIRVINRENLTEDEEKLWKSTGPQVMIKALYDFQKRKKVQSGKFQTLLDLLKKKRPELVEYVTGEFRRYSGENNPSGNSSGNTYAVEAEVNSLFEKFFSGEMTLQQVSEYLESKFKSSVPKEKEVFECVTFHLFRELQFMNNFPEDVLTKLGSMVGVLILNNMVSQEQLNISMNYILKSLKNDKEEFVHHFGESALRVILPRIKEWPDFSNSVMKVAKERYPDLAAKLQAAMSDSSKVKDIQYSRESEGKKDQEGTRTRSKEDIIRLELAMRNQLLGFLNSLSVAGGGESSDVSFLQKLNRMQPQEIASIIDPGIMNTTISYMAMLDIGNLTHFLSRIIGTRTSNEYWLWFSEILVTHVESEPMNTSLYTALYAYLAQYSMNISIVIKNRVYERVLRHLFSTYVSPTNQLTNLGKYMAATNIITGFPVRELLLYSYIFGRLHVFIPFFAAMYSINVSNLDPSLVAFLMEVQRLPFITGYISEQILMFRDQLMTRLYKIPDLEVDLSEYLIIVKPEENKDVSMAKFDRRLHGKYFYSCLESESRSSEEVPPRRGRESPDTASELDDEPLITLDVPDYSMYAPTLSSSLRLVLSKEISDLVLDMLPKIIMQSTKASLYLVKKDFHSEKEREGVEFDYSFYLTKAMFHFQFQDLCRRALPLHINEILLMDNVRDRSQELVMKIFNDVCLGNIEKINEIVEEILVLNIKNVISKDPVDVDVPDSVARMMPKYLRPGPPHRSVYLKPYKPEIFYNDDYSLEQFREWVEDASAMMRDVDPNNLSNQREKMKEMFQKLIIIYYKSANPDKILEVILDTLIKQILVLCAQKRDLVDRLAESGDPEIDRELKFNRFRESFLEYSIINLYESSVEDPYIPELISRLLLSHSKKGEGIDVDLLSRFFMNRLIDISMFDDYLYNAMFDSVDVFTLVINILLRVRDQLDGRPMKILPKVRQGFSDAIKIYFDQIGEEHQGQLLELEREINGRNSSPSRPPRGDDSGATDEFDNGGGSYGREEQMKVLKRFEMFINALKEAEAGEIPIDEFNRIVIDLVRDYMNYGLQMIETLFLITLNYYKEKGVDVTARFLPALIFYMSASLKGEDSDIMIRVYLNSVKFFLEDDLRDAETDFTPYYVMLETIVQYYDGIKDPHRRRVFFSEYMNFLSEVSPRHSKPFTIYWIPLVYQPELVEYVLGSSDESNLEERYFGLVITLLELLGTSYVQDENSRIYGGILDMFSFLVENHPDFISKRADALIEAIPPSFKKLRDKILPKGVAAPRKGKKAIYKKLVETKQREGSSSSSVESGRRRN